MNLTETIRTAREAHEVLRSRTAGTRPDEKSSAAYRAVKTALEELWTAAQQHPDSKQVRGAIGRLTVDAEYFAGLNDGEGFREATEVWQRSTFLQQTVGAGKST